MLGHLWLSQDVDVAKKEKHPQKSQNHPSYHEKIPFTVRNTAAQEMAADGAAGAQVQESVEQEVSCGQAQQKMGHRHLLHPHQVGNIRKSYILLIQNVALNLEQKTGIEPAFLAWEANVLPLNYFCI